MPTTPTLRSTPGLLNAGNTDPMANQASRLPQLTREEMTPPVIQPVPPGIKRPRWSVMIPTYNCARFLRETLESVLSQGIEPGEMQIEVIDDCSTSDDPEAVVHEFGQGRVSFYRKPANAGAIANFNTCIERSTGHYVHILHGDDFVKPGFYQEIDQITSSVDDTLGLYACCSDFVDESGVFVSRTQPVKQLLSKTLDASFNYEYNYLLTPSCVVSRLFYERHGGFLPVLVHTADWEMWIRTVAAQGGIMSPKSLACYRSFAGSDTSRLMRSGGNILDILRLGVILRERYADFDIKGILELCSKLAQEQANKFRSIGEDQALIVNMTLKRQVDLLLTSGSPRINKMRVLNLPFKLFTMFVQARLVLRLRTRAHAGITYISLRFSLLRSLRIFGLSTGYLPYLRSSVLKSPVGMITQYERAFLCWYAAKKFAGIGLIVELGSFAGASTVALAEGLIRSKFSALNTHEKMMRVYDRYVCGEYEAQFLNSVTHSQDYYPGQTFYPLFARQTSRHKDQFEVFKGDLNFMNHDGSPIEFLFVDSMKDFQLTEHIARQFFPALVGGASILLHQDYVHYYTSWIHILMFTLRDYFEYLYHIPNSASAVFKVVKTPSWAPSSHDLMSFQDRHIRSAFGYSRKLISGPMRENIDAAEVMHFIHLNRPAVAQSLFQKWKSHHGSPKYEMAEVERILASA
jgi:glycosyltransferase involved in cell wall biosynthesis